MKGSTLVHSLFRQVLLLLFGVFPCFAATNSSSTGPVLTLTVKWASVVDNVSILGIAFLISIIIILLVSLVEHLETKRYMREKDAQESAQHGAAVEARRISMHNGNRHNYADTAKMHMVDLQILTSAANNENNNHHDNHYQSEAGGTPLSVHQAPPSPTPSPTPAPQLQQPLNPSNRPKTGRSEYGRNSVLLTAQMVQADHSQVEKFENPLSE